MEDISGLEHRGDMIGFYGISFNYAHRFMPVRIEGLPPGKNPLDMMLGKRFVKLLKHHVYFTPKHGSWLNMVEVWSGIMGQKCLILQRNLR
jgi:hypothetical protein